MEEQKYSYDVSVVSWGRNILTLAEILEEIL